MTTGSTLDLRLPIGVLFLLIGGVLAAYGLRTAGDAALYLRAGGVNVNLLWGSVMVGTGLVFLGLARRSRQR